MNQKNIEKLVSLFEAKKAVYELSNKRIAERNHVTLDEVYEAKRIFKENRNSALIEHCKATGIDFNDVKYYWHKSQKFSMNVAPAKESLNDLKDALISEMQDHSPKYISIKRNKTKDGHLLVIDPADIHIGKLSLAFETGEEYNTQMAVRRVLEGVQGLLDKSSGFNIDKILLIIGNDILHVDSPKRQTTSGTPQDTDGMWYSNFLIAKQMYVEVIEMLMQVADVHVQYDPSNHDYTNGFFLADTVRTWFRTSPNVTFNTSISHRKYFAYGKNLIGTTHGDGAKEQDLPLLMAQESSYDWVTCNHRYFYTHHIHHKKSRDYGSVCVESLRSPSGTDSWHHRNGYQHSPKAVEAFIHHPEHGQVCRITHLF